MKSTHVSSSPGTGFAAGRLGDQSRCASGSGPAISASANVLINNRGALRLDDAGTHDGCSSWQARTGAPRVLINGRLAHRLLDVSSHSGQAAKLVTGSATVLVRKQCISGKLRPLRADVAFVILDASDRPMADVEAQVTTPAGESFMLRTDFEGRVCLHNAAPGEYLLRIKRHWVNRILVRPLQR